MTGVAIMSLFVLAYFVGETPYAVFQELMGGTSPAWFTMLWIIMFALHDIRNFAKNSREDR